MILDLAETNAELAKAYAEMTRHEKLEVIKKAKQGFRTQKRLAQVAGLQEVQVSHALRGLFSEVTFLKIAKTL